MQLELFIDGTRCVDCQKVLDDLDRLYGKPAKHVRNAEKYYDRTVQEWHMLSFHRSWCAIDIDLVGACEACYRPLYLFEAAEQPKKSQIVRNMAESLGIPAFLVIHNRRSPLWAQSLWSPSRRDGPAPQQTIDKLKKELCKIRQAHREVCRRHGRS